MSIRNVAAEQRLDFVKQQLALWSYGQTQMTPCAQKSFLFQMSCFLMIVMFLFNINISIFIYFYQSY